MSTLSNRTLYWLPRVITIAFIGFLSLFALDVLNGNAGIAESLIGLGMHLVPSLLLVVFLVIAWRREWIGTLLFAAAGVFYVANLLPNPHPSPALKLAWSATIAGPAFVIAVLFWLNWIKRDELRRH